MGLCFIPHGAVIANWTPADEGALKLSRTLMPLEPFKDQVVVVSNLAHAMAAPAGPGDNGGDHTRSPAVFLNGVHPKRTDGADIHAGVTIDQIAALKIGQETPLPSLELATEDYSGLVGSCDVGFSCAYMNTISWRTPTTPLPMEINPRLVFDRMFGDGATSEERLERIEQQRSILDAVTSQVRRLQGGLGSTDRSRVSEYLDTVREIERRIQLAEKQNSNSSLAVPDSPSGIPDDHEAHSKLMFDLMALSFQADITRISTFMMAREVSYRTFPMLGISEGFHPASHHQNNAGSSGESDQDQHLSRKSRGSLARKVEGHARWRRQSSGPLPDSLRKRDEQQQHSQSLASAGPGGRRRGRKDAGRPSREVSREHAHGEPADDHPGQGRHPAGKRRRQHGLADGGLTMKTLTTIFCGLALAASRYCGRTPKPPTQPRIATSKPCAR